MRRRAVCLLFGAALGAAAQSVPVIRYENRFAGADVGSGPFEVSVVGTNLHAGAVGLWNGERRGTRYQDGKLYIQLAAGDLARVGMGEVRVADRLSGAVSNPLPFFVWLPGKVDALAHDPARDRLYVASQEVVRVIDGRGELLGVVERSASVLRAGDGGQYLYVLGRDGPWRRFELLDDAPWLGEAVEMHGLRDIVPMPGAPQSFAGLSSLEDGKVRVAIYDGPSPRPLDHVESASYFASRLAFDGPSRLYWVWDDNHPWRLGLSLGERLRRMRVSADGLEVEEQRLLLANRTLAVREGRIFTRGRILSEPDIEPQFLFGGWGVEGPATGPDGLVGYIDRVAAEGGSRLVALDARSLEPRWILPVPDTWTPDGFGLAPAPFAGMGKGRFAYGSVQGLVVTTEPGKSASTVAVVEGSRPVQFEEGSEQNLRLTVTAAESGMPISSFFLTAAGGCGYTDGWSGLRLSRDFTAPSRTAFQVYNVVLKTGPPCLLGTYWVLVAGAQGPATPVPLELELVPTRPVHPEPAVVEFRIRQGSQAPDPKTLRLLKEGDSVRVYLAQRPTQFDHMPSLFLFRLPPGGAVAPGEVVVGAHSPAGLVKRVYEEEWLIRAGSSQTPLTLRLVVE